MYVFNNIKRDERLFLTNLFPGAVPNNHTPPDDDIERNLCVELFVVVNLAHFLLLLYTVQLYYIFLLLISI